MFLAKFIDAVVVQLAEAVFKIFIECVAVEDEIARQRGRGGKVAVIVGIDRTEFVVLTQALRRR